MHCMLLPSFCFDADPSPACIIILTYYIQSALPPTWGRCHTPPVLNVASPIYLHPYAQCVAHSQWLLATHNAPSLPCSLLQVRHLRYHPRWQRQLELRRKKALGPPKGGDNVSIVVTDVEGYSQLMSSSPHLMSRAMSLHDEVMRRVAEQHCGSIVEQVGGVSLCGRVWWSEEEKKSEGKCEGIDQKKYVGKSEGWWAGEGVWLIGEDTGGFRCRSDCISYYDMI
jgi:hypothetical protein